MTASDVRGPTDPEATGDASRSDSRFGRCLLLVGIGAFAVRLVYAVLYEQSHGGPGGDAFYYHWQANALADGLGFIEPYAWKCSGLLEPSAAHPPLYSAYLALFSAFGGTSTLAHRIATALAGTGGVVLVGLAGREWRDERTGVVAASLAAVVPFLWINDALLMSETVFAATIALTIWTSLRYRRAPGAGRAGWVGVAVALATLARAEAILLVPLLLFPLLAVGGHLAPRRPVREVARHLGVGMACLLAVLAPWTIHNLTRFERPVVLSTGFGSVLAVANCDDTYYGRNIGLWSFACGQSAYDEQLGGDALAATDPKSVEGISCISYSDEYNARLGDESRREAIRREVSVDYIRDHTTDLVRVLPARLGRTLEVYRPGDSILYADFVEGRGRSTARAAQWSFFAFAALAITGLRRMRRERLPVLELGAMFALVVITSLVTYGNVRFRVPLDVALILLVAVPLTTWLDRTPPLRTPRRSTGRP